MGDVLYVLKGTDTTRDRTMLFVFGTGDDEFCLAAISHVDRVRPSVIAFKTVDRAKLRDEALEVVPEYGASPLSTYLRQTVQRAFRHTRHVWASTNPLFARAASEAL